MPISIRQHGNRYAAEVSLPHGSRPWSSPEPLTVDELVEALRSLGCHTTDIADAFYAADPHWLEKVNGSTAGSNDQG